MEQARTPIRLGPIQNDWRDRHLRTHQASYNANGEQTGRTLAGTAYSLSFDYDGQLTQITQGGNTTSFAYDALGRRFSRTAGGTTTQFQYAGSVVLLEKQGGTTTGVYSYGNGLLRRGGEYPMFDGSGSERTVTNSSQSVTGSINFEAFGQTAGSSGSSSSPYMFAGNWGYRTEGDAGLMKVGARYYDAQVGRFITRDTVLSQHPYLYCEHEPVGFVDPSARNWAPLMQAGSDTMAVGAVTGGVGVVAGPPIITIGLIVAAIGGIEWGIGRVLPDGPPDGLAPPTDDERRIYRREIHDGWDNGTITPPPGYHGPTLHWIGPQTSLD